MLFHTIPAPLSLRLDPSEGLTDHRGICTPDIDLIFSLLPNGMGEDLPQARAVLTAATLSPTSKSPYFLVSDPTFTIVPAGS